MSFALFMFFAVVSVVVLTNLAGPPAEALAGGRAVEPANRELVLRFIERSRRYRRGGAWVGVLLAALVAWIAEAEGRPLIGQGGLDLVVLFAIGLGGSVAGSVAAEAFRLRPRRGVRTASLEVRDRSHYEDPVSADREVWIAAFAVVAASGGVLVGQPAVALWLLPMALLVGLRRWATRRIALRPRPAVGPELAAADDQVRELAASAGLGRPLTTLVLLLLCFQLGDLSTAPWATRTGVEAGSLDAGVIMFGAAGSIGALLVAVVWWSRNRTFGLEPQAGARRSWTTVARACLIAGAVLLPVLALVAARS